MSVSYTLPRLEGGDYARFVELALHYAPAWGLGYTTDGAALLFTAQHARHDFEVACHDLASFAAALEQADDRLRRLPPTPGPHQAHDADQASGERRHLAEPAAPAPAPRASPTVARGTPPQPRPTGCRFARTPRA
ncbi:hypothetical protein [Nocardiopsis suaedae]|uniref:Uncharacterized protein n=1 Tax=Nocardiopsis suaedae TaxID=3018444 RepID=A0ABT4TPV9_9ACTN|nr:hypothetical protein [Nocardiopsis suaedae]MDA2806686.1 hypothetical protein [Nocardiopsis suaedae]